ncbi:zinc-binding dehydrogenase [Catenulispora subtropica]|uniref:Zinc-binding dehydrogenase n=1 Tax=Catenulispora subtropica TaxID=450798 RepID=A0ABN2SRM7_9ACTN
MLSVINAPGDAGRVAFAPAPSPTAAPNQALIDVRAFSVNRGELALLEARPAGWRPGQDIAGTVAVAAADGTGPAAGSRVVGRVEGGGWAERVAVDVGDLAVLPDAVSFTDAATLPVAGTTAIRTLRLGGDLLGRRVLITAASGAVGRFQVELAAIDGAVVTAVARKEYTEEVRASGAADVVPDTAAADGLYSLISESVGGASFNAAISKVEPGGTVVLIGTTGGQPGNLSIYDFIGHEGARVHAFLSYASGPAGPDLARLVALIAEGRLHPAVGYLDDWTSLPDALTAFAGRAFSGKAVLTIP